ncbi:STAS domain-containing protein [Nocardioides salarius]|uniref:Anti-anti-sigma factor n=1 Tax=Nocardioides salarius TaxID=374513 RepID=A0ABS2M8G7_9ACTN|nr:STAS domain-containing protein [Nocardioides salarius]MBM7507478.1 anti-anti-sigma factor [Nocardioides salarius]
MGNDTVLSTAARTPLQTRHTVTGDLDVAAVHRLRSGFAAALDSSDVARPGLDLDLGGVTFMDAAGLGAVMWCRQHALRAGFACVVDEASPAALRLMKLTGTHDLLRGFAAAPLAGGAPV